MRMKADVYLHDECPRIGCGWRRVEITAGPKHVRIREISTGKGARLDRWPLDGRTMQRFDMLRHLKPREIRQL